jgi:predicted O-linked N-acetylglucosamine transferase (SPINDLY family)
MGLLDLVAHDKAHFVSLALRLGNDPTFRQDMVTQIIHR